MTSGSLAKALKIKAEFDVGGYNYNVLLQESVMADPVLIEIGVEDPNNKSNGRTYLCIDFTSIKTHSRDAIGFFQRPYGSREHLAKPDTPEAVQRIRQALNELKTRISTPSAAPQGNPS